MKRKTEHLGLPKRWRVISGVYYYDVPKGKEKYWEHKKLYRLGKTYEESLVRFKKVWLSGVPEEEKLDLLNHDSIIGGAQALVIKGVYFLILKDEIVYIGRSNLIYNRITDHICKKEKDMDFTHVFCIPCEGKEQERLEQCYINKFKPIFNIKHTLRAKNDQ